MLLNVRVGLYLDSWHYQILWKTILDNLLLFSNNALCAFIFSQLIHFLSIWSKQQTHLPEDKLSLGCSNLLMGNWGLLQMSGLGTIAPMYVEQLLVLVQSETEQWCAPRSVLLYALPVLKTNLEDLLCFFFFFCRIFTAFQIVLAQRSGKWYVLSSVWWGTVICSLHGTSNERGVLSIRGIASWLIGLILRHP